MYHSRENINETKNTNDNMYYLMEDIKKTKKVKVNKTNRWLIELIFGDAVEDKTAKFHIPSSVYFKK